MPEETELERCKGSLLDLREQLVRILGTKTTDLMMERAAIEVLHPYPAMALIKVGKRAPDFGDMDAALSDASDEDVRAAFEALRSVVLLVLARLLGDEMTGRLVPRYDSRNKLGGLA